MESVSQEVQVELDAFSQRIVRSATVSGAPTRTPPYSSVKGARYRPVRLKLIWTQNAAGGAWSCQATLFGARLKKDGQPAKQWDEEMFMHWAIDRGNAPDYVVALVEQTRPDKDGV